MELRPAFLGTLRSLAVTALLSTPGHLPSFEQLSQLCLPWEANLPAGRYTEDPSPGPDSDCSAIFRGWSQDQQRMGAGRETWVLNLPGQIMELWSRD